MPAVCISLAVEQVGLPEGGTRREEVTEGETAYQKDLCHLLPLVRALQAPQLHGAVLAPTDCKGAFQTTQKRRGVTARWKEASAVSLRKISTKLTVRGLWLQLSGCGLFLWQHSETAPPPPSSTP